MHGIVNVRKLRNGDLKRKQTMIKILIIEDEIRLADVLYDWFYNKNFQVTVCHDGIWKSIFVWYCKVVSDFCNPECIPAM